MNSGAAKQIAITVASGSSRRLWKKAYIEHTASSPRNRWAHGRRVRSAAHPPLRTTQGASSASTTAERLAISTGMDICPTACLDSPSITDNRNTPPAIQAMPCSGWSARTAVGDEGTVMGGVLRAR